MILEICVDDIAGVDAAVAGGADRLELCGALTLGGLSPAASLIAAARDLPIPAHALLRPREGGFCYSAREAAMIASDMTTAAEAGLAGVVIGASGTDHMLDAEMLARFVEHAAALGTARGSRLSLTLHRAFDLCPDLPIALETAISLGFDRVLTSGGEPKAPDSLALLAKLHDQAAGRIVILAGSGIDAGNAEAFVAVGLNEIHASCGVALAPPSNPREAEFGFTAAGRRATDAERVRALRQVLDRASRRTA